MTKRTLHPHRHLSRRSFIKGAGVAAASAAAVGATPATALGSGAGGGRGNFTNNPLPNPIPATVDGGGPAPFDLIHWLLPGPPGASTQIIGLEAFGLDVDPSMITDFNGFVAYAVIAGTSIGSDGANYPTELDVRVMDGEYVGVDGSTHRGTFGFF